ASCLPGQSRGPTRAGRWLRTRAGYWSSSHLSFLSNGGCRVGNHGTGADPIAGTVPRHIFFLFQQARRHRTAARCTLSVRPRGDCPASVHEKARRREACTPAAHPPRIAARAARGRQRPDHVFMQADQLLLVAVPIVGFVSGFINTLAGSGSLITLPLLIVLG